jgi:hypothetical protein
VVVRAKASAAQTTVALTVTSTWVVAVPPSCSRVRVDSDFSLISVSLAFCRSSVTVDHRGRSTNTRSDDGRG